MTPEAISQLSILATKEQALSEIIAWLKGRGLWEECNKELLIVKEPKK